jgi:hypothetical protein
MEKTYFYKRICGLALLVAVSVGTLGILGGCTRKQESSSITVAMPDWNKLTSSKQSKSVGALATVTVVSRVMINVSGPDIQNQIVYIWELNDNYQGSGSIPTPPTEHTLTVPRGSNRLIQVLAILEEIDTESQGGGGGNMSFYYGEAVKSIANAVEPVTIALVQESTASAGDGSISGRYFNADGSTPTGPVDMYYAPLGRRPMIVERTSIFSGHFHFYLMPTVPFTFRMRDSGVPLFENVTTTSFASRYSDRLLQIAVPPGYSENGGGGTRQARSARSKVVGFAGPGATLVGRATCYPTPSGPLPGFYDAATGGSEILWNPASALSTEVRILGGGIGTADGQCAAYTNVGVNSFPIYIDNLMNGDSPLGNRGPFKIFDLGGGRGSSFLDVSVNNGNLTIKWEYLAEVVGNSVDGVGIFYKVVPATESMEDRWHDSAPCNQLSSFGFTEITRVPAGAPGAPVVTYDWTTPNLTAFNAGRLKTVLCPYTNAKPGYYDFAISHYTRSGGGGAIATKIMATSVTEPTLTSTAPTPQHISESTCTALRIVTADAAGTVARRPGGTGTTQVSVTASGSPPGVTFYEDLNCSTPVGGTATLNPYLFQNVAVIGVKADSSVTTFEVLVNDLTSGGSPLPTITHHMSRLSPLTATEIVTIAKSDIKSWQCYPIGFVRGRYASSLFIGEGGISSAFSLAATANLNYYLDEQCETGASPNVPLAADQSSAIRFFKYSGNAATLNVTPDISVFSPLTQSAKILNVTPPSAPTVLRFEIPSTINASTCTPFRIVAKNGQSEYSPVSTAQAPVYNFSTAATGPNGIFTDPGCSAAASSTLAIGVGLPKSDVYYLFWDTQGPLTLSGSGSSIPVEAVNLTIGPP